ncbi:MAG: hypothetical protein WCL14_11960 [Bacteroidota bacterium]
MVSTRIMVRPAIRCSRCIPITDTKQRAAATIGAIIDGRQLRNSFQQKVISSTLSKYLTLVEFNTRLLSVNR